MSTKIEAYIDGSCLGNPGPGGWSAILTARDGEEIVKERVLIGGHLETTNNRMEIRAAIGVLGMLTSKPVSLTIYSDSQLVIMGMTKWVWDWIPKWKKSNGKPVENRDLWELLVMRTALHNVTWKKVEGHAGIKSNEQADELASYAAQKFQKFSDILKNVDRNDRDVELGALFALNRYHFPEMVESMEAEMEGRR